MIDKIRRLCYSFRYGFKFEKGYVYSRIKTPYFSVFKDLHNEKIREGFTMCGDIESGFEYMYCWYRKSNDPLIISKLKEEVKKIGIELIVKRIKVSEDCNIINEELEREKLAFAELVFCNSFENIERFKHDDYPFFEYVNEIE